MTVKHLCAAERQAFVDCMFVHSPCVQSGALSIDECMKGTWDSGQSQSDGRVVESLANTDARTSSGQTSGPKSGVPPKCIELLRAFSQCHAQIFDWRTRFRGFR